MIEEQFILIYGKSTLAWSKRSLAMSRKAKDLKASKGEDGEEDAERRVSAKVTMNNFLTRDF